MPERGNADALSIFGTRSEVVNRFEAVITVNSGGRVTTTSLG